jgi:hypothetical protein
MYVGVGGKFSFTQSLLLLKLAVTPIWKPCWYLQVHCIGVWRSTVVQLHKSTERYSAVTAAVYLQAAYNNKTDVELSEMMCLQQESQTSPLYPEDT